MTLPFFSAFADKPTAARVLLLLGLIPAWLGAAGTRYQIDPERSSIGFEVRHLASTVSGSFAKFSGSVDFDPDDVAQCRAEATIDVGSLVTDDARRTGRLARDDFFATAKFPMMLFESQSWRQAGDGTWAVVGKLTIKGIAREIVMHVREQPNQPSDGRRRWEATVKLNRKDFGVSGGPPGLIGDEVSIMLKIEAIAATRVSDSLGRATMVEPDERGERLLLRGTVFAADRRTPVPNATLRIFHTDADGLYSRDADNAAGERNPRLNVVLRTDADGRYEVQTIVPGRYPGGKTPAHVHMTVSAEGYRERTATFSFAGDPALTPEDYARHGREGTFSSVRPLKRVKEGVWHCQRDIRLGR